MVSTFQDILELWSWGANSTPKDDWLWQYSLEHVFARTVSVFLHFFGFEMTYEGCSFSNRTLPVIVIIPKITMEPNMIPLKHQTTELEEEVLIKPMICFQTKGKAKGMHLFVPLFPYEPINESLWLIMLMLYFTAFKCF